MDPIIFLICFAALWLIFASVYDIKKRIIPNWAVISLAIFALGFRFFYSLFSNDFLFFYQGLIGLGIFFILGNLLYYARIFAGGDSNLMVALGTVLPFYDTFSRNLESFALFIVLFLFVGGIYGIFYSGILVTKNYISFKKEFRKQFGKNKKFVYLITAIGVLVMLFGFFDILIFYLGILIFIAAWLFIYSKSVDETCLIKNIKTSELEEGDWLYKDVKIDKKTFKANWKGLTKIQIGEIRKKLKKVEIRYGVPFVPVFLISFLIFVWIYFKGVGFFGIF